MLQPNVFLIVVDSLRADHVQIEPKRNSQPPELTPHIAEFAKESITFTNCFSQGISTAPSMTSILTSTYPLDYGGHWYIHEHRKTIAEILQGTGYSTIAIHSNPNVSRLRNFHKGFDVFEENLLPWNSKLFNLLPSRALQLSNKFFRVLRRQPYLSARALNRKILYWLEQVETPFFVWTQYMDTHGPYLSLQGNAYLDKLRAEKLWRKAAVTNPDEITVEEEVELRQNYKAEVRYTDEEFGAFIGELKKRGYWENSIIILASDHGDEFREHGLFGHKNNPYDELIRVPLIIKFPAGFEHQVGTFVQRPVRLLDLMPTILDISQVLVEDSPEQQIEGKSLIPLIQGNDSTELFDYIITEKEVRNSDKLRIGIRTKKWKYIMDGVNETRELYNLIEDASEQMNVINDFPDVATEFEEILSKRLMQIAERSEQIKLPSIVESAEVKKRLEDLGYL